MDSHVRILGNLNIVFGVTGFVCSLAAMIYFGGPDGIFSYFQDRITALVITAVTLAHLFLAIPAIVGGIFLRQFRGWARSFMIVISALNAMNLPIGTVLGIYGLWVLLMPETDPLFMEKPPYEKPAVGRGSPGQDGTKPALKPAPSREAV